MTTANQMMKYTQLSGILMLLLAVVVGVGYGGRGLGFLLAVTGGMFGMLVYAVGRLGVWLTGPSR